jgi:hypothetical protein
MEYNAQLQLVFFADVLMTCTAVFVCNQVTLVLCNLLVYWFLFLFSLTTTIQIPTAAVVELVY